jgi:hypothetical protein
MPIYYRHAHTPPIEECSENCKFAYVRSTSRIGHSGIRATRLLRIRWTSAANGALLSVAEAAGERFRTGPRGWLTSAGLRWCDGWCRLPRRSYVQAQDEIQPTPQTGKATRVKAPKKFIS